MKKETRKHFSEPLSVFRERRLPADARQLAGYGALIRAYDLPVPLPARLSVISKHHHRAAEGDWMVFTPRHRPEDSLAGHLVFALRYEGIELGALKRLFLALPAKEVRDLVNREPTSLYRRKIWFLYEWLTDSRLDLPDADRGNYTELVDTALQYAGPALNSRRHRVRNNLPGTLDFCPMIRRTGKLDAFVRSDLHKVVGEVVGKVHSDVIARAAAFLLLRDSKASFAIEGERPTRSRAERWGRAIGQAGTSALDRDELLRLQQTVIEDSRFTKMGWRREGGFIGAHDRETGDPIPDHISARPGDIKSLIGGIIEMERRLGAGDFDPVMAAAMIAFGFVFIHPFSDGNGRIHRYLVHHVLASKGFTPKGLVFPVSAVILERVDDYRKVLEDFSVPRQEFIKWRPTGRGNVEVMNDTSDLYRYFDATAQAEFLYECVDTTIRGILPQEVRYLDNYDRMKTFIDRTVDMPDHSIDLLIRFLRQNSGKLSKRARNSEFGKLTAEECGSFERKYAELFGAEP